MSHLEYQTPSHPGPFAQQQQYQQQQAYAQSPNPHQFNPSAGVASASAIQPQPGSSGSSAQAFSPAPSYPGHNHSRPLPPQFHDGLMQQQAPHFSPAASFGEWPDVLPSSQCSHPVLPRPSTLPTSDVVAAVMLLYLLLTSVMQAASRARTPRRPLPSP